MNIIVMSILEKVEKFSWASSNGSAVVVVLILSIAQFLFLSNWFYQDLGISDRLNLLTIIVTGIILVTSTLAITSFTFGLTFQEKDSELKEKAIKSGKYWFLSAVFALLMIFDLVVLRITNSADYVSPIAGMTPYLFVIFNLAGLVISFMALLSFWLGIKSIFRGLLKSVSFISDIYDFDFKK